MAIFWVYSSHSLSLGKKVCRRNLIIMTNQKVFFRTLEFVLLVVWFVGAISGFHLEDECIYNKNMRTTQDNCKYGWEIDACGNKLCTKGPGDFCGGRNMRYGICGEGLMCSNCNRCHGCSLKTFECFDDSKCMIY